jgi:hypothetical protein
MPIPKPRKSKEEMAEISRENGKKAPKGKVAYPKSGALKLETGLADMYADIYDPRAKVDPNLKIHAASCFMLSGTVSGAARLSGLDQRLISAWKKDALWWDPVLAAIKHEKQDELDSKFTALIHDAADALSDRLKNGEEVVTKDGIIKKKLGGRDISMMLNTLYNNRAMLRGDPTSITRKESSDDVMQGLRKEFASIAKDVMDTKVVSDQ